MHLELALFQHVYIPQNQIGLNTCTLNLKADWFKYKFHKIHTSKSTAAYIYELAFQHVYELAFSMYMNLHFSMYMNLHFSICTFSGSRAAILTLTAARG